jgi:hypothetical protein
VVGCDGPYSSPDPPLGSYAPQITYAFPEPGTQVLPEESSLTFTASGLDSDSLVLAWEWELDDAVLVFGESVDGSFDESWTLEWSEEISGFLHEVCFIVRDDDYETRLFWPIEVE